MIRKPPQHQAPTPYQPSGPLPSEIIDTTGVSHNRTLWKRKLNYQQKDCTRERGCMQIALQLQDKINKLLQPQITDKERAPTTTEWPLLQYIGSLSRRCCNGGREDGWISSTWMTLTSIHARFLDVFLGELRGSVKLHWVGVELVGFGVNINVLQSWIVVHDLFLLIIDFWKCTLRIYFIKTCENFF